MAVHRFAQTSDIPALCRLWRASFPEDAPEQIEMFLNTADLSRECLIAEEGGAVVSMVFLLPALLKTNTQLLPMQYIYAAATLPAYRGQGLFGALLKTALEVARDRGECASFLRPAQPSLCKYYAKFGYRPFFYCDTLKGVASVSSPARAISAEAYVQQREQRLPPVSVLWQPRFFENTVSVGQDGCAVCEPRDGILYIRELLCSPEERESLCGALCSHFGCRTYECRVPAAAVTAQPFGLLCPLQPFKIDENAIPYMGIALD